MGGLFRRRVWSGVGVSQQNKANVAMDWRWDFLCAVSTKLFLNRIEYPAHSDQRLAHQTKGSAHAVQATQPGPGGCRELEAVELDDPRYYVQTGEKSDVIAALVRTGKRWSHPRKIGRRARPALGVGHKAARRPLDSRMTSPRGTSVAWLFLT